MRDTFGISDHQPEPAMMARGEDTDGLRHSIRPRQSVIERESAPASTGDAPVAGPRRVAAKPPATQRPADLAAEPRKREIPAPAQKPATPRQPAAAPGSYLPDPSMPRWHELSLVETGSRQTARTAMPVADAARDSTSVRAFDLLRTRLRQTTQEHGWTNIAIASPSTGCGNTFTSVNLALSLSRISNSRTVLMDFNLRSPAVAKAFDVTPPGAMRDFLLGRSQIGDHIVRVSDTLALGLNNRADSNSADTLQAAETARTLERMRAALQPELVIYDMPAMLAHDDLSAFLPQLDGVLLVSDGSKTMPRDLLACERMLEGQVPLLGVVLNRARRDSIPHYH